MPVRVAVAVRLQNCSTASEPRHGVTELASAALGEAAQHAAAAQAGRVLDLTCLRLGHARVPSHRTPPSL